MSTLLVEYMENGLAIPQRFRIVRPTSVKHVRALVYISGNLGSGEVICRIKEGATVLDSTTISAEDINAIPGGDYKHGMLRFDFDNVFLGLKEGGTTDYLIELEYSGDPQPGTIGIQRQWESPIYVTYNPDAIVEGDNHQPRGVEIYTHRGV